MAESLAGHPLPSATPKPPQLRIYEPPTSQIWVATLPNWRRRFLIAGGVVVTLAVVGLLLA